MKYESFSKPEGRKLTTLIDVKDLTNIQQAAEKFGVSIKIISKAGEVYVHEDPSISGDEENGTVFTGSVPEGQVYVSISSDKRDLSDFWAAVKGD